MKAQIIGKFSIRSAGLAIAGVLLFSATGCRQSKKPADSNSAVSSETNAGTSGSAAIPDIGEKANAIVGQWETTTAMGDKIRFEFAPSKIEGDSYAGMYTFYVNDTKDAPAKYTVTADSMIKFFNDLGQEYPLIKVSVSSDGKTINYFDQKDVSSQLTKSPLPVKQNAIAAVKEDCKVKKNNVDFFVTATEKTIKLGKGTSLSYLDMPMHQGIITVKAKVEDVWIQGEIRLDDTTCN